MKLTLANKELAPAISFLQQIKLKGENSRHRSKLVKLLSINLEEMSKAENELLKENNLVDEQGIILPEKDQNKKDAKKYIDEQKKLYDEPVVIEGGAYVNNISKIQGILEKYDEEISGVDAEMYDRLLEDFEKNTDEKTESKEKEAAE